MSRLAAAALGALVLVGAPAAAAPKKAAPAAPAPKRETADAVFEESVAAYRAGDFAKAAELLQKAYALKPAPVLLYNLARAYEGMGNDAEAVKTYRAYLKDEPTTPDRGAIEAKITTLENKLAEQERLRRANAEQAKRAAEPPPAAAPPPKKSVAPWLVVGGGGLAVAGSVVLFALASSKDGEAESERVQLAAEAAADDARTLGTAGLVTAIVGGALVAGGLVWALAAKREASAQALAHPLRVRW